MSITKGWAEKDLFDWLKANTYPDLVKANNPMSRWDCYSPETTHRIELKCRKKHYETLLIERKKYDSVMDKCSKNFDVPIYINSTPEGVYLFNLLLVEVVWEINHRNPATTDFSNTKRVAKEVAYLCINNAVKLL